MLIDLENIDLKKDSNFRLQTFYNYFKSIEVGFRECGLLEQKQIIASMQATNKNITRKSALTEKEIDKLRQSLYQSWNTRIFLHQYNLMSDEFLALSLPWLPTMYYYALYHSLQTYFRSAGKPHAGDHSAALTCITEEIKRFPHFLSSTCEQSFSNVRLQSHDLKVINANSNFSNLTRPDSANYSDHISKFLVTTRNEILDRGFVEKRKKLKRTNLTKAHKEEVDKALKPISIFHFFYRMRKRFNYEDGEITLQGGAEIVNPKEMYLTIKKSYTTTIIAVEWLAANYAGKNKFLEIFKDFESGIKDSASKEQLVGLRGQVEGYFK